VDREKFAASVGGTKAESKFGASLAGGEKAEPKFGASLMAEELQDAIDSLEAEIKTLIDRLAPVLQPDHHTEPGTSTGVTLSEVVCETACSPLNARMRTATIDISRITRRVIDLTNRVDC
jgi:hypothetical protein